MGYFDEQRRQRQQEASDAADRGVGFLLFIAGAMIVFALLVVQGIGGLN